MLVRTPLTKLQRTTLGAMVTLDVHGRDVLTLMAEAGTETPNDFNWVSQLRYYYNPEDPETKGVYGWPDMYIKIITATAKYGWEYLGNSFRLVVTQLTDRCYRTLMSAHQLTLGGAPRARRTCKARRGAQGPRQGAREAVRRRSTAPTASTTSRWPSSSRLAARRVGVFDEFNRIDLEVLSVVAQQILTIQRAIAAGVRASSSRAPICPSTRPTPSSSDEPRLPGRSSCDNLKVSSAPSDDVRTWNRSRALFTSPCCRPCPHLATSIGALSGPDYALIGEIRYVVWLLDVARPLAKKIDYPDMQLCSEQLSSQDHYDYGMRAVKSVLTAAGNLKRALPNDPEPMLVLRSIRDVNLPKFLSHDVPLFNGSTSDLFPGVELPPADYDRLLKAINRVLAEQNMQPVESFVTKVLEVYEMFLVRHGFMIVGLPFAAKTQLPLLAAVLSLLPRGRGGLKRPPVPQPQVGAARPAVRRVRPGEPRVATASSRHLPDVRAGHFRRAAPMVFVSLSTRCGSRT